MMETGETPAEADPLKTWASERGVELGTPGFVRVEPEHGPGRAHYCRECFQEGMRYEVGIILGESELDLADLGIDDIEFVEAP